MPELTLQDRESYKKLYNAATTLRDTIPDKDKGPKINSSFTLEELTEAFVEKLTLTKPEALSSFEQLQAQVELTGGYLTMYQLLAVEISNNSAKDNINQAFQELQRHYNQLKMSLEAKASQEVDDDDFLDNVTTPCSDPLFLGFLENEEVRDWTQQLMSDQAPALTNSEVQKLIDAWGKAVTKFVEDARKDGNQVDPGRTETIAHFFCIHDQLEGLYSELSTAVALNS